MDEIVICPRCKEKNNPEDLTDGMYCCSCGFRLHEPKSRFEPKLEPERKVRFELINNEDRKIIKMYSEVMNLSFFHKSLFFLTNMALSFLFLSPIIFKNGTPPGWFLYIICFIIIIWNVIMIPKHFITVSKNECIKKMLFNNSIVSLLGLVTAAKPSEVNIKKHPWILTLFYLSLAVPILCIFALLIFFCLHYTVLKNG